MEASCRDLGLMDYKTCWELQQGLFDALVAVSYTHLTLPTNSLV